MKTPTRNYRGKFVIAITALVFSLSCSKDADLLEEYAISDSKDQLLNGFVIDDVYNISPSGTITIDVLANDLVDGYSNVVITSVTSPSLGTVEINDDNTITYTLGSPAAQTSSAEETSSQGPETTSEPEVDTEETTGETDTTSTEESNTSEETTGETDTESTEESNTSEETTGETDTEATEESNTSEETTGETDTEATEETDEEDTADETDSFNYTVETTDEDGDTTSEEGTVTVTVEEEEEECPSGSIVPEYRLNGVWSNGQNELTVASGTEVLFSMLPNDIGVTIEFPDGTVVGDNYNIGAVTPANSGDYLLTSAEGCTTVITLTVDEEEEAPPTSELPNLGALKAFPGAEGFGKNATGGRGGRVIEVTNLNDSGSGSLREAIEASGTRTVVFKVAGYITLNSTLNIANGNITIAGQTAPGDGITIRRSGNYDQPAFTVKTNNVIVRGLRIRAGKGPAREFSGDTAHLGSANNVIFDHCSFSWSTDEILGTYIVSNVTFQNCIMSEGLMYSSHEYTTNPNSAGYYNPHSMGALISSNTTNVTIYNSIFAHNNQRNPLVETNSSLKMNIELVNNVYYNWGVYGTVFSGSGYNDANFINNLHIPGRDTKADRYPLLISSRTMAYAKGNFSQYRTNSSDPEWNAVGDTYVGLARMSTSNQRSNPFDFPLKNESAMSRDNILNHVTSRAGAFVRDAVDGRVIQDIFNNTGNLINDPNDVGGFPSLSGGTGYTDTDRDGMSDAWESAQGLNPNDAADGIQDRNGDGYTNLEEFLHNLTL